MHSKPNVYAKHILLFAHYFGAYLAILDMGSSLGWLIFNLINYALLSLIFRYSQNLKSFVQVEAHRHRTVLPRKYERFLTFFLTIICIIYLLAPATPVYAQFFGSAQTFVAGCFPQAGSLVSLVFNVLRFLLLIYLGIALAQAISAVRDGQSVSAVATPPLLVVVVVTAADIASTLIIGGAAC